jgi:hypothetical protein
MYTVTLFAMQLFGGSMLVSQWRDVGIGSTFDCACIPHHPSKPYYSTVRTVDFVGEPLPTISSGLAAIGQTGPGPWLR